MTKNLSLINAGRPGIYKMSKEGEEDFYFDSTDLSEHKQEFEEMERNGWVLVERLETLPAYLTTRMRAIENAGYVPDKCRFDWGYKKK